MRQNEAALRVSQWRIDFYEKARVPNGKRRCGRPCGVSIFAEQPPDALHQAIRQNDLKVLDSILKHDNVNAKDDRGATPLLYAAEVGSADAVKVLVSKGADVNVANTLGVTPLMVAAGQTEEGALPGGARG
ncbi:MAG: ankyrin repeat domain-containing protein [Ignavibacteriota bacterium]